MLRQYVNGGYLSEGNWAKVQAKFAEDGSVQLHNFLAPSWAEQVAQVCWGAAQRGGFLLPLGGPGRGEAQPLQVAFVPLNTCSQLPPQAVAAADEEDRLGRGQVPAYDAGMHGGWQAVGPCHKQRYLRYSPGSSSSSAGSNGGGGIAAAAVGALLGQIHDELFASAAFAKLLSKVSGQPVGGLKLCMGAGGMRLGQAD